MVGNIGATAYIIRTSQAHLIFTRCEPTYDYIAYEGHTEANPSPHNIFFLKYIEKKF